MSVKLGGYFQHFVSIDERTDSRSRVEFMLENSRSLLVKWQNRKGRSRIYAPRIKWSKWLSSGAIEDEALPSAGRKENRDADEGLMTEEGSDEASNRSLLQTSIVERNLHHGLAQDHLRQFATRRWMRLREKAADTVEWIQKSEDLRYAFRIAFGVMLVTWPGYVPKWTAWYSQNRGSKWRELADAFTDPALVWAAFQLIFITEVSIGTSIKTTMIRGIGTTLGCLWGWAAVESRNGDRFITALMVFLGIIPCIYIQLAGKYPKAGMVTIISLAVVAIATEIESVPGKLPESYLALFTIRKIRCLHLLWSSLLIY